MKIDLTQLPVIFWAILFLVIFTCVIFPFALEYLHRKEHVRVERPIKKLFLKKLHAHLQRHIHPKNPRYKQCHQILGFAYLFQGPGHHGFGEKNLPDTISSDFQFDEPQTVSNLLSRIKEALASPQFVVSDDLEHPDSVLVLSHTRKVRVRIIPASTSQDSYRFRLICTWLTL